MSEKTGIAWCDSTVNFWWGCQEVSSGCDHCYAKTLAAKLRGMAWGPGSAREQIFGAHRLALKLNRKALKEGRRLRVFTNSMSDFFDNQVPTDWRDAAWATIHQCPALDWLILTKRPQNLATMLPEGWDASRWPHVWLGVSAENQTEADRRIPILLNTPAALRWVSFEPLLSPIVLDGSWRRDVQAAYTLPGIDWAVIGGESGAGRRDCGAAVICNLRDQCRDDGIAVFVKRDSARLPDQQGRIPDEWFIREWPVSPAKNLFASLPQKAG